MPSAYDDLPRRPANFQPLSPLSFLARARDVHGDRPAWHYGATTATWREAHDRAARLASALGRRGIGRNDTVAFIAPNIPALFDATFGVAMAGAVLNPINTRLEAATIRFILEHGEARLLVTDTRLAPQVKQAVEGLDIEIVDIVDAETDEPEGERLGALTYDELLAEGDPDEAWSLPDDEWDAISLNYTSGTTSDPKGVVVHHRGAHLIAMGTIAAWPMAGAGMGEDAFPVHMSIVPLFHCNGWGHAWALAAVGGATVLVRNVTAAAMYGAIAHHRVTHFNGAPTVLGLLIAASDDERAPYLAAQDERPWTVRVYTAAAPPPPSVLARIEALGLSLTHVYGLTETYGHVVECAWQEDWAALEGDDLAARKSRQGVRYAVLEGLQVADPETMRPVPADGETMGEVMMRGNVVMKGYLKNPTATDAAFAGGWFHSGDLAVMQPDGYLAIRDRAKDIIISGGENISSVEVEAALHAHPDVTAAAVVAAAHEKWGEVPHAFVELRPGASVGEDEMIAFARERLAGFKTPKRVTFGELPKTSTGKIQKFVLREKVRDG